MCLIALSDGWSLKQHICIEHPSIAKSASVLEVGRPDNTSSPPCSFTFATTVGGSCLQFFPGERNFFSAMTPNFDRHSCVGEALLHPSIVI